MSKEFKISGKVVDVFKRKIYNAQITVKNQKIEEIQEVNQDLPNYIIPGLVDAHVHIESSMLIPSEFARAAVAHGTVATVSDPHEIANVMGMEGIDFMINNGKKVPFKFYFGAPSCVPATPFETSGAVIDAKAIQKLMQNPEIYYLAEMMNFPGVLFNDKEVLEKINHAIHAKKPIDGHAPGLINENIQKYASKGISTDHECTTLKEAIEKINHGIKIQIREGSAAKNFENLSSLIKTHPENVMFCTDDCHPDDLIKGHINKIMSRAIKKGANLFNVLSIATLNPKKHYNLKNGLLQKGDYADMVVVDNLKDFNVKQTYINGELVFDNNQTLIPKIEETPINKFNCNPVALPEITMPHQNKKIQVIIANDGDLYTGKETLEPTVKNGNIIPDTEKDILKIVVVNRYKTSKPQVGFIKNFGLKKGALAGSIAHDSHNIIAIGASDEDIITAINQIIKNKGGIVASENKNTQFLKLNVAGLMSTQEIKDVASQYSQLNEMAKKMGSKLNAPFMTMAFMALLVIPELKIGDKGLFDVSKFDFTSIFTD